METSTMDHLKNYSRNRHFSDTISPENYLWWRKTSASKTVPSSNLKIKKNPREKPSNLHTIEQTREKIIENLGLFRAKCNELARVSPKQRGTHRIDCMAMQLLKNQGLIPRKLPAVIGSIPGLQIGDTFNYRVELMLLGIHRRNQNGIDFIMEGNELLATCIVATEGYDDKHVEKDVLSYVGEGGFRGGKERGVPKDQVMKRGNLALKNSCRVGNDVRVVKGVVRDGYRNEGSIPRILYVFDGLYKVVECISKKDLVGNSVFVFELKRNPAQDVVPWHKFKSSSV